MKLFGKSTVFTMNITVKKDYAIWESVIALPFSLAANTAIHAHYSGGTQNKWDNMLANLLSNGYLQVSGQLKNGDNCAIYGSAIINSYNSSYLQ